MCPNRPLAGRNVLFPRQQKFAAICIDTAVSTCSFSDVVALSGSLLRPTTDTAHIVAAALPGLKAIYRPGFKLAKAGLMLMELQSVSVQQCELDLDGEDERDRGKLMVTMDRPNQRYGKGSIHMASAGFLGNKRGWSMKQVRRTPGYMTRWEDMSVARA
jgi:DNA polymerase V